MGIGSTMMGLGYPHKAEQPLKDAFRKIEKIHADSTLEKALAEKELAIFVSRLAFCRLTHQIQNRSLLSFSALYNISRALKIWAFTVPSGASRTSAISW